MNTAADLTRPVQQAGVLEVTGSVSETKRSASASVEFQQHVHIFRAVAIILIIGAHSIPSFSWEKSPLIGAMIDTVCAQASIFFIFISGYLFQYLSGRFQYVSYLKQKFKTILLPYLIVSVPAIVISVWFIPQEGLWSWFYDLPKWQQIGLFYLTGKHLEPLWFVPMMVLFYLAAPLLLAFDRRPALYAVLPFLILVSVDQGRGGPWGPINMVAYMLPAYLAGMAFSHFRDEAERLSRKWVWLLTAASAVLYALLVVEPDQVLDWQFLLKLILCPVLLLVVSKLASTIGRGLDYVAHVSFGIYFVHAYLISAFRLLWTIFAGKQWGGAETTALFPPSVALFLFHTLAVLLVSMASIWVVQKIFPKHSRQLIGA